MKLKKLFAIFLFFCMNLAFSQNFIFDEAGLLSKSEASTLNEKLSIISKSSGTGIYIVTINDYNKYATDIETAAEVIYSSKNFGIGEINSGLLFLISMNDRSYDLDSFNDSIFTRKKRTQLENAFLGDFAENKWYLGFSHFVSTADSIIQKYQSRIENGEIDEEVLQIFIIGIIVIFLISLIIALVRMSSEKKKLNNIDFAKNANIYESANGVNYSDKRDLFTHTTVRVIVHEQSKSSGSRSSGGHSHSSGHF